MTANSIKPNKPRGRASGSVRNIIDGRMVSLELFKRHGWFILIATVIVIALIGQRYTNQTKMQEIKRLEKELAQSKSIEINEKAKYMSLIRENEMRKLLKEKHLNLDYQEQPPYVISKN
ncbi:MAG: FtsL-like putative cell division protein [Prevotella sp.]|nr:FtsL-like putative cell division protein [Prevotella sp.]MCM1075044.1 FtsL-like putative cell division protein [Ruminococcus sp.]